VLQKHGAVLEEEGGLKNPDPDTFVQWISKTPIAEDTALFTVKCDAFGDLSNRNRRDVYNPLRDGDVKEQLSVTVDSLYAEKVLLADHKRSRNIANERALLPQSELLIGYNRFLPEIQTKGVPTAPAQKPEVQEALELRLNIGLVTPKEQRACFYLVKQGVEQLKGWLFPDHLKDDEEYRRLASATEKAVDAMEGQQTLKEYFEYCSKNMLKPTEIASLDIMHVGADKPIAYEEYAKIERTGQEVEAVAQERKAKGFGVLRSKKEFYIFDRGELVKWQQKHHAFLAKKGLFHEQDDIVRHISEKTFPPDTAIFTAIADIFGDFSNNGRIDIFRMNIDNPEEDKLPVSIHTIYSRAQSRGVFRQFQIKALELM